jgi:hypothetical protein
MEANRATVATRTANRFDAVVPVPNCPSVPSPQQYAWPVVVRLQEWASPIAMAIIGGGLNGTSTSHAASMMVNPTNTRLVNRSTRIRIGQN